MVRHPVVRLYSQLTFDTMRRTGHFRKVGIEPDLHKCLDGLQQGRMGSSFYCETIEDTLNSQSGLYLRYFCGQHVGCETRSLDWRLARAKRNVETYYAAIGILEYPAETMALFRYALGIPTEFHMPHHNPSSTTANAIHESESIYLQNYHGMKHDIMLYNFMVSKFCSRLRLLDIRLVNCTTYTSR